MLPDVSSLRPSRRFQGALIGLWVLFTLVFVPLSWIGTRVKYGASDFATQVIWESGWILWAPMSLLVVALCRRFPLNRQNLWTSAFRLAALGVGVVLLQVALEFTLNTALGMWLRNYKFTPVNYIHIVAYKGHAYYVVYWMIVGAAHAYEFHQRYRESEFISSQLEMKLANAELDRLKAQLQPHFLFNTHHMIVSLMLKKENDAAIRMLTRLSDLLRISLSRSSQQLVSLREELETLRLYLEIQRERFRDRLTVEISLPPELQEAEFPHLLLQPLVENALEHGLEDTVENGRLEISFSREEASMVCAVKDNGAGFEPESDRKEGTGNVRGIGLVNTRERLQQLYGSHHALTITSAPGAGCTVTIHLPYRPCSAAPGEGVS